VLAGEPVARVAAGVHATFASLVAKLTRRVATGDGVTVALGGGCMVSRILRRELAGRLGELGIRVLVPARVPPGDGGLSYGQAVLGAVALARGCEPRCTGGA
jgi:hydrogenase maturation protein HypF